MFNRVGKRPFRLMMRNRSQWSLGGIALWLIAAILATFVVCTQKSRDQEPAAPSTEVEIEVEVAD